MATKDTDDKRWTPEEIEFILTAKALTAAQKGAKLGRSRKSVESKLNALRHPRASVGRKPGARKGEAHHKAVLTEAQVLEIRQKRAEGATHFALFEEYPVESTGTISAILSRKTWKHI